MTELLTLSSAELITDKSECIFAVALLSSFPDLNVYHQYPITSSSGRRNRLTIVDFMLMNSLNQKLLVEVASGNNLTKRKRRQRKTVGLAGLGEIYVALYGKDISRLKNCSSGTPSIVDSVLRGKYNGNLFSFRN